MDRLLYIRKEFFGGVVFEPTSGRYFNITQEHFDALGSLPDTCPLSCNRIVAPFYPDGGAELDPAKMRIRSVLNPTQDRLSAPLKAFFNLTKRCNLFCVHCYNDSGHASSPELDLSTVLRVIDTFVRRGIFKITLSGGEPLYHPSFDAIAEYLAKTDLYVSIVTNGICISDQRAERLASNTAIRSITISLDGGNSLVNDTIRGVNAFARTVAGTRRLLRHFDRPVALRITLAKSNVDSLEEFVGLAARLGIREVKVNRLNAYGRAHGQQGLSLTGEEFQRARDLLVKYSNRHDIAVEMPAHQYRKGGDGQLSLCRAGEETCEVDGDGNLYPCSFSFGNLAAGNLRHEEHGIVFDRLRQHSINNSWCLSCKGRGGDQERVFGQVPDLVNFATMQ
ncbi:radical SAM protein [Rhizobium leguminosarum]|nr:radical SAM protein [Rhizobium leguminosarum]